MNASSSHSPLHKPEQGSAWTPPLDMALGLAREALVEQADANVYDKQAMIAAAVQLEIRLRGLVAALDKDKELAAQVAAHGPFPMPTGESQPVGLTEEQAEALINAGNGALSDYYHERQCHCSDYPAGCVTNPGYRRAAGFWDTDAFAIGLPAVLGVWESLRNDRHAAKIAELRADNEQLRARVAKLEAAAEKVAAFCAQRAEYVTSLVNCNPDNGHDYDRWQGHAAARRQLSQLLGLPVGWPAEDKQPVPPVSTEDPARCLDVHPFTPRDGWRLTCGSCDHAEGAPCHHRGGTS